MNRRRVAAVVLAVLLVATILSSRLALEGHGGDRVPAGLLYLPEGPYLRALAVGHEETLADVLYIWALQYYSNYDDRSRYGYLDAVFRGAITDLDPNFTEAYIVGALIMSVEARKPQLAIQLLDKGMEKMPWNWELAYWAGWEAHGQRDYAAARTHWNRAAAIPGAPPQLFRLAARMLEKAGDKDAAIAEYAHLAEHGQDEKTRGIAKNWLARLLTERALEVTRAALSEFRGRYGRCPESLEALVRARLIAAVPAGPDDAPFHYDPARCEVLPPPGLSFGAQR